MSNIISYSLSTLHNLSYIQQLSDCLCSFFSARFPALLLTAYAFALTHCSQEPLLQSYFPENAKDFLFASASLASRLSAHQDKDRPQPAIIKVHSSRSCPPTNWYTIEEIAWEMLICRVWDCYLSLLSKWDNEEERRWSVSWIIHRSSIASSMRVDPNIIVISPLPDPVSEFDAEITSSQMG